MLTETPTCPGAVVSGLGREHGDANNLTTRNGSKRSEHTARGQSLSASVTQAPLWTWRREQTASRTLKFSRGELGQDNPKRLPREPPGPPWPPGAAVMVNVSACTIEFTHSEFSFSAVVHPA